MFRPRGIPLIQNGFIKFQQMSFYFAAPLQIFEKAKNRGIENKICRIVLNNTPDNGILVDVGANYGFISLVMGVKTKSQGKVYSFEAIPQIASVLESSIEKNEFCEHMTIVNQPVTDTPGKLFIMESPEFGRQEIISTSLDSYFFQKDEITIHLIKIDVDGGDLAVLLGGERVIKENHPILIVEMSENQQEIFQFIKDQGYQFVYNMDHTPVIPDNWPNNIIASMKPLSW